MGNYDEIGTPGIEAYYGFVQEAYNSQLYWPAVAPLYNRIWRSDPEVTIARMLFDALSGQLEVGWEIPEKEGDPPPSADDDEALAFAETVLDDIQGGIGDWLSTCMTRVPFFGWGWWEAVPCVRRPDWRPPGDDPWRSNYDDGRIGYRRLAFRQYSSFEKWDMDDQTGRIKGMVQQDYPNPQITIPLDRSLHITFGDNNNPEGLATLEAIWRLERLKYGLEVVQGIGFEHAAGHVRFTAQGQLDDKDKTNIREAARAIMSAQEGNYMALPEKISGELIDVGFAAAPAILSAIQYYGVLKLSLLGMQWVALSATTGAGSYAAMDDSSTMAVMLYNAMAEGFVRQADDQIGKRLFTYNADAFPGMTRRPELVLKRKIDKKVALAELAQFCTALNAIMPLGDDDYLAIRRKSGFLPEVLPPEPKQEFPTSGSALITSGSAAPSSTEPEQQQDEEYQPGEMARELSRRPFALAPGERPTIVEPEAQIITEQEIDRAVRKFEQWAKKNAPEFANLLRAKVQEREPGNGRGS